MTQHSSLKIKGIGIGHRSVLKRFERILRLKKEEKWKEGDPIFGLPKVKSIRAKIRKEKAAAVAPAPGAAVAGAPEGTAGAAPAAAATAAGRSAETPAAAKIEPKAKPQAGEAGAKESKKKN